LTRVGMKAIVNKFEVILSISDDIVILSTPMIWRFALKNIALNIARNGRFD